MEKDAFVVRIRIGVMIMFQKGISCSKSRLPNVYGHIHKKGES